MKRIIAILAITASLVGMSTAFAPSASAAEAGGACAYAEFGCILVYKLTRLLF